MERRDVECQFCNFTGSFAEGVEHRRSTQHLLRTVAVGELRRSEQGATVLPADRAWTYVETHYAAKVDCGVMEIHPRWTGLLDAEDIRATMKQIADDHNQHAALVEQRDRLLRLLRPVTSPTACYCAVMRDEKCWHCEARELIATTEQGEGRESDSERSR